ncbi:MAG: membrane protein insertase YidC [Ignavibacteriae bacterium]|nr:membrane protein insertase YidC [Ignavibacteria bacterium]MBI3365366.1 membrane protein insertase YidC [Ignavibacteriota bacterium]
MDRSTVIGFVLIGLVLMLWMWMNAPTPPKPSTVADTTAAKQHRTDTSNYDVSSRPTDKISVASDTLGKYFSQLSVSQPKMFTIETPLYQAELSTKGGSLHSWVLKKYKTWNQYPVNLINGDTAKEFNLVFLTSDGKLINTKQFTFEVDRSNDEVIALGDADSFKVNFILRIDEKRRIVKSLTFHGSGYSFDAEYRFEGMQDVISNYEYQVTWENGLRYLEHNSINESNSAKAYTFAGGELTELDAANFNDVPKQSLSGRVSWVATRNKYFAVAIIPREKESQGAYIEGRRLNMPDNGAKENYSLALKMPFTGQSIETGRYTVYIGPLDFDIVKQYNVELERIMSLGAAWIIRPISEYVIIPLFKFLHLFIANYGIVLIIFALIIKIVLYPLTKSSMVSMRKMQALQPVMEEIREKFKNDPQKMNQQVMRLYKEYGVNPAGGCLPLVLQMPILYALWAVFSSTIELRQASFVGWIHDLSSPDVAFTLPFRLPIFGVDQISGLALLMGITMFIQQKMSVKDPRQKAMVWMMPILMTLLFNSFPSGLNLYYFIFNILTIGQQSWMNKSHKNEPLKKVEEKKRAGGIFNRLTKNLPNMKR